MGRSSRHQRNCNSEALKELHELFTQTQNKDNGLCDYIPRWKTLDTGRWIQDDDRAKFNNAKTKAVKTDVILSMLQEYGDTCYDDFVEGLKRTDHRHGSASPGKGSTRK